MNPDSTNAQARKYQEWEKSIEDRDAEYKGWQPPGYLLEHSCVKVVYQYEQQHEM